MTLTLSIQILKVIQYLKLTIAFKFVLSQSSQILLPLCNPATPSLAVSCFNVDLRQWKVSLFSVRTKLKPCRMIKGSVLWRDCRKDNSVFVFGQIRT